MDKGHISLLTFIGLAAIVVLSATAYLFLYKHDYPFVLEAECDPSTESCYVRDCSSEDSECPPNEFENYKIYRISAYDFPSCTDNSCAEQCTTGTIECEEELCDANLEESCSVPPEEVVLEDIASTTEDEI